MQSGMEILLCNGAPEHACSLQVSAGMRHDGHWSFALCARAFSYVAPDWGHAVRRGVPQGVEPAKHMWQVSPPSS